jgi:hypothetical protein
MKKERFSMKKLLSKILGILVLLGVGLLINDTPVFASEISVPKMEDFNFNPEFVDLESVVVEQNGIDYKIVGGQFVEDNTSVILGVPKTRASYTNTFTLKNKVSKMYSYYVGGGATIQLKTYLVNNNGELRSRQHVIKNSFGEVIASQNALGNPASISVGIKNTGTYTFVVTNSDATTTYKSIISWSY